MPDTSEESIAAESVPYVEDATLSLPVKYDTRILGMTTSVKDQGDFPLCLTYARIAALETALIKKGYENNTVDLSEMHMLYERWLASSTQKTFGQWCEYSGIQTYGLESSFDNSFQLCNFPVYETQMPRSVYGRGYLPKAAVLWQNRLHEKTVLKKSFRKGAGMNDRDIRVVENMLQSGMEKETVFGLFPQFPRQELEKIAERIERLNAPDDDGDSSVSINCS